MYLKSYKTINAPIIPQNALQIIDGNGRLRLYNPKNIRHCGKEVCIRIVFDNGTSQTFSLNTRAPNIQNSSLRFCDVNSLGMYFSN